MEATRPTPPPPSDFATTRWSLVADAGDGSSPRSREALETLCRSYWAPLHAYVRRRVADTHEAQDLTQGFFTRLLERNDFAAARADRGRFRAYLLTAFKHFLINEWDKARAQKRGGGRVHLSLDFDGRDDSSAPVSEPSDSTTPEQAYERAWATTMLSHVFERLRAENGGAAARVDGGAEPDPGGSDPGAPAPTAPGTTAPDPADPARRFELLKPFIAGGAPRGAYAGVAEALGLSEGAARMAAQRLRARFGELLRAEVAETVRDPALVDEEIAALFAAVRPAPRIL